MATNYSVAVYQAAHKLTCLDAEPQSPRDLSSTAATGLRAAKQPVLTQAQLAKLPQTNLHYHLGAEHKSDEYSNDADTKAWDLVHGGRRSGANPRPGFMCNTTGLTGAQMTPYSFVHCTGSPVVGKTYEFHFVHSSAGVSPNQLADGLGAAAGVTRGLANPTVGVRGIIVQIVNDASFNKVAADMLTGAAYTGQTGSNTKMYAGSTTGTSFNNNYCSPYTITWHVDTRCNKVSASSLDAMCALMKSKGMTNDLSPHNSRILLDGKWVVPAAEVLNYA